MASNSFLVKKSLNFESNGASVNMRGDMRVDLSTPAKLKFHDGTSEVDVINSSNNPGITALTGDILATGPGSADAQIAAGVIVDADINAAAAITRTKIANGTPAHVVINDPSTGALSSEAQLAKTRGGTGISSTATFPASGTIATYPITPGDFSGVLPTANGGTGQNSTATFPTSGAVATVPGAGVVHSNGTVLSASNVLLASEVTGTLPKANGGTGYDLTTQPLELPEISTPATPASGFGRVYFKSDNKLYQLGDDGIESKVGAGAGGINYLDTISDGSVTTGINTYNDGAGTRPIDGTGGTVNGLTTATSTSSPLRGTNSLTFAKDAVNRQGEGWSYDFTIDAADQGKQVQFSFDYTPSAGTYAGGDGSSTDSDLIVYIYRTTATARLIEPVAFRLPGAINGTMYQCTATFQTDSDATGYRAIWHIATTSASAWTIKLDNLRIGPQITNTGTPVTDWQTYVPGTTAGWGSLSSTNIQYRRVGKNCEIRATYTSTTPTATEARWGLPPGLTSASNLPPVSICGSALYAVATASIPYVLIEPNVTYMTFGIQSGTQAGTTKQLGNAITGNNAFSFYAAVPIEGWSSSAVSSQDAAQRTVAMSATMNTALISNGAMTQASFNATLFDTHRGISGNTYIVPVAGIYEMEITAGPDATTGSSDGYNRVAARKNGVQIGNYASSLSNTLGLNLYTSGSWAVQCVAGDVLDFAVQYGQGSNRNVTGTMAIKRLAAPEQILASETVAAQYTRSTTQSITNGANVVVDFATKVFDRTNSVTTGASWRFTAPKAGVYDVSAVVEFDNASWTVTGFVWLMLWKNGSFLTTLGFNRIAITNTSSYSVNGASLVEMIAGDYIEFRASHAEGSARNLIGSATQNRCSIKYVGN